MTYRKELDGLRALAVLAVIVNHLWEPALTGGYLGVDVFFVISGYVITASLLRRPQTTFRAFLSSFYERRIKRLIPALVLCIAITAVAVSLFNPTPKPSLKTALFAVVGLSNLQLLKESTDYFGVAADLNAFTHTWSLGVEEQFYLLYPLLFWALCVRGGESRGRRRFLGVILGLGLVSFAAFALLYAQNQSLAYFSMPTRFWELAAGGALFIMLERRSAEMTPARRAMPGLGLLGLAVAYAAPGTLAVPATVLAVAATLWLLTYVRPGTATYRLLTTALLVRIGVISYSLYLWHWSVIVVARYTVGVSLTTIPLLVLLMTALAAASYKYVESPLRVATWHRLRRGSIAYGLAASAAGAVLIVSLARPLAGALYLGAQPELEATGTASLGSPVVDSRDGSVWSGEACALASPDDVGKRIPVGPCTFGNPVNASQRILVVGNSYSTAFAAAYELLASQHDVAITLTSSWGASALPQLPNTSPFAASNAYYWSSVVPELSAHLEKGDILLIASDLTDLSPASRTDFDEEQLARLSRGIDSISTELRSRGAHLAILGGLPFAREAYCAPVQAIPQWFAPGQGPCIYRSRTETMERLAPLQRTMEALRASAGLLVIDLMPIFCPGETCSYFAADGQLLYRDEWSHPSIEAARLSVKTFERELPLAPLQ